MKQRPNVLWIMTDQHHAGCVGYNGHPDVKTPALDRLAGRSVNFTNAFANNPICAPSRVCFMTGRYIKNHRRAGNDNFLHGDDGHAATLAAACRQRGYQTAVVGKSHMVPAWDAAMFEHVRYTDIFDACPSDPRTCHYFDYLCNKGLGDFLEDSEAIAGNEAALDGSRPSVLKYEDTNEHYTGNETLAFLQGRDRRRPFFLQMSFYRPHSPILPAQEFFDLYDPDKLTLPPSAGEFLSGNFKTKHTTQARILGDGLRYPLAADEKTLRRCLASYYGLITAIDGEIGRALDFLEREGELDNTIVLFTADHGDFAGEHGLFHKNLGIYDAVQRIPFLLSWPGGPGGIRDDRLVESVDWFPTVCDLCDVPPPGPLDGQSLIAGGTLTTPAKEAVFCEWCNFVPAGRISSIRTGRYRLNYSAATSEGELYDHQTDPGETRNLYADPAHSETKTALLERLLAFNMTYGLMTDPATDSASFAVLNDTPARRIWRGAAYWSDLEADRANRPTWPPPGASPYGTDQVIP
ncbi:MAG: sulfatase-like hydrolase/transferase [Phycisphaerae bacterium]|nr:sulfatase-like hydrolase/transferase [Phycisphaerae bacterium]